MRSAPLSALVVSFWLLAAATAGATSWQYPKEISVAEAFNALYGTGFAEHSVEGLDALRAAHEVEMTRVFTLAEVRSIAVITFDTGSTQPLGLLVNGVDYTELFDPGPWTAPTRGWINDPTSPHFDDGIIDLTGIVDPSDTFEFVIYRDNGSHTALQAQNTVKLTGLTQGELLLGYNGGGVSAGDADLNEPLLLLNREPGGFGPAVPEPAAVGLFVLGLTGIVAYIRRG